MAYIILDYVTCIQFVSFAVLLGIHIPPSLLTPVYM